MEAKILNTVKGRPAIDGAGVKLVRVLGGPTIEKWDPFLMMDSFDSTNYDDYKAGFPTHPHRGIETITYLLQGHVTHEDSMGNKKTIGPGMIQWMTAGSGILHSEVFEEEDRLLGLQLWLNLPKKDKMTSPKYQEVNPEDVAVVDVDQAKVRVLAGDYQGQKGYQSHHNPMDFYAIDIPAGQTVTMEVKEGYTTHLFTLLSDVTINGEEILEKTDVLMSEGSVTITAKEDAEVVWMASPQLDEPVAWGGPIVMNTDAELRQAFQELHEGTFIKEAIEDEA